MRTIPPTFPPAVVAVRAYEYSLRACNSRIEQRTRQHKPLINDVPLWYIEDPQEILWILMSHRGQTPPTDQDFSATVTIANLHESAWKELADRGFCKALNDRGKTAIVVYDDICDLQWAYLFLTQKQNYNRTAWRRKK